MQAIEKRGPAGKVRILAGPGLQRIGEARSMPRARPCDSGLIRGERTTRNTKTRRRGGPVSPASGGRDRSLATAILPEIVIRRKPFEGRASLCLDRPLAAGLGTETYAPT
jgi:hypothetical protein